MSRYVELEFYEDPSTRAIGLRPKEGHLMLIGGKYYDSAEFHSKEEGLTEIVLTHTIVTRVRVPGQPEEVRQDYAAKIHELNCDG